MDIGFKDIVALILNYNSADLTISCVNQLLMLTTELKILIVDNHSTDESLKCINATYENQKQVSVLSNSKNLGYAGGNNYGFNHIRKSWKDIKYVMLLNPDIIIKDRDTILKLKKFLDDNNDYSIVSSQIIFNNYWRGFKDFGWKLPTKKQLMWAGTFLGKFLLKELNNNYSEVSVNNNVADVDAVSGCFFIAKLEDLKSIGDFDDRTFLYFEETILASKLKKIEKKEAILVDEYVFHNHKTKDKVLNNFKKRIFDRKCFHNSKLIYIKYYSGLSKTFISICKFINDLDYIIKKIIYGILSAMKR